MVDGALCVEFSANNKVIANEELERILNEYVGTLSQIIEHCVNHEGIECTPHDLGINNLTIENLDCVMVSVKEKFGDVEVSNINMVTPMQNAIIDNFRRKKSASSYIVQNYLRINGVVDIDRLKVAFNDLSAKYSILRTIFDADRKLQIVLDNCEVEFAYEDIVEFDELQKKSHLVHCKKTDFKKGIDITNELPIRLTVIRISEEEYVAMLTYHHIILDGWSSALIFGELFAMYEAPDQGYLKIKPDAEFTDYIIWLLNTDNEEGVEAYREYLDGYKPLENTDSDKFYAVNEKAKIIDTNTATRIKEIARANGVTENV